MQQYNTKIDILGQRLFVIVSAFLLFKYLELYLHFDSAADGFYYIRSYYSSGSLNLEYTYALDGPSISFLLLTAFIFPFTFLFSQALRKVVTKEFSLLFLLCIISMEFLLILIFQWVNLFFFYFSFEAILIPMFMVIGIWGARERRINAAYYFFFYTLITSMFIFVSLMYLYSVLGGSVYPIMNDNSLDYTAQYYLAIAFFITFATKIPTMPFHLWLPEAHVEAPTIGSVILAALLLKLGGFGFVRFSFPLFILGNMSIVFFAYILSGISVIFGSLITLRQLDLKRIIAYSSIAHMNLCVLGLYVFTQQSWDGSLYLMLGHGIVSGALFLCIGVLYDRYHTRILGYYGGLVKVMPLFACIFFICNLANMGFPGTVNFIGEFLIYTGIFEKNSLLAILALTATVLSAVYSIFLFTRIVFGTLKTKYILEYSDVNRTEGYSLFLFCLLIIYFGLSTAEITDLLYPGIKLIIQAY